MKTLFTLIISFPYFIATAQVPHPAILWLKGIGGSGISEVGNTVIRTNDNGFIIGIGTTAISGSGNIDSFCTVSGDRDIFIKYNSDASVLEWTKCYQLTGDTGLGYIFPTNDGGFVLGGQYNSSIGWGFYICKQDALGNIVWSHSYSKGNNLGLTCMTATYDGGYIMAGGSFYTDTNVYIHYGSWMYSDIFVLKVDSLGNKVWAKVIGGTEDDAPYAIVPAPNNGCYIVGLTASNDSDCIGNHGNGDVYLARLDRNGNILWHNDLGGSNYDYATCAIPDNKGGVIIGAATNSIDGDVTSHLDTLQNFWVINVDSSNHIVWNKCYGGGEYCYPNSICKAADGSIWMAGVLNMKNAEADTNYGRDDAWFVHADSVGNFINAKVLGGSMNDRGTMIYPLSNGNVIAGGFYDTAGWSFCSSQYTGNVAAFLVEFLPWTVSVSQINATSGSLKVYPVPANDVINIDAGQKGNYYMKVSGIVGNLVYTKSFDTKAQISVSGWEKGVYYVEVMGDNGYRVVQKLIVD